jgi:hypothetical protein
MGEANEESLLKNVPSGREYKMPGHKVKDEMKSHYTSAVRTPTEKRITENDLLDPHIDVALVGKDIDAISNFFEKIIDNPTEAFNQITKTIDTLNQNKNNEDTVTELKNLLKTTTDTIKSIGKPYVLRFLIDYKVFICQFIPDYHNVLLADYTYQKTLKIIEDFLTRHRAEYHLTFPEINKIMQKLIDDKNKITSISDTIDELNKTKTSPSQKNITINISSDDTNQKPISVNIAHPVFEACNTIISLIKDHLPDLVNNADKESGNIRFIL